MRLAQPGVARWVRLGRWIGTRRGEVTLGQVLRGLLIALIAIGAGIAVAVSPLSLAVIGGLIIALWLVALGRQSIAVFHGTLIVLLAGYAFLGKGFAYFGFPPLYVGEFCLAIGALAILHAVRQARFSLPLVSLVLFMAWGLLRTVPYLGTYGLFAVRDGVTWEYGLFAIAVALTIQREHVDRVVAIYRRGALLLVWWIPVATILTIRFADSLPRFPDAPVPFVFIKAGDSGVHLAAIAGFVLLGLYAPRGVAGVRQFRLWAGWFIAAGFAALNRGAILSMSAAAACFMFVFSLPRLLSLAFVGAVFAVMLLTVNPEVDLGLQRNISVGQLIDNITSITGGSDPQLEASKNWRLAWWSKIVGYTVGGPYFWVGKGFGVNLATDDGFQVDPQESLRAPHNTHLEILARAGVPGITLWVLFQIAFASALLRAVAVARRINEPAWVPLLGWVFVYWLAALVNGSFDVYLGGPQGGIWFWGMIGLGLGLIRMVNERAASIHSDESAEPSGAGLWRGDWASDRRRRAARVSAALALRPAGFRRQ